MKPKILIVDDDVRLQDLLREYLSEYGYDIERLLDGHLVNQVVRDSTPDVVILDLMMPGKDGFEVIRDLRTVSNVPVIMLTAKGEDSDRIVGLELGADDYISKPFNPRELLARIRAVARRFERASSSREMVDDLIRAGGLKLDVARHELDIDGDKIELTSAEFNLLAVFMRHPGIALSRDQLMNLAWGHEYMATDRTIDVHVSKLRSLLRNYPAHERRIITVWGVGYKFVGTS